MKSKLTITVDSEILPLAKRHAKRKGVSLSSLIEQALREMTKEQEPSFSEKWRGKFKLAERGTPRYEALVRKYLGC